MSWQPAPLPSQIRHWYWKLIGAEPAHVPGLAVSVLAWTFALFFAPMLLLGTVSP